MSVLVADGLLSIRAFEDRDLEVMQAFNQDAAASTLAYGLPLPPERLDSLRARMEPGWKSQFHRQHTIASRADEAIGFFLLYDIDWINRTLFTASTICDAPRRGRGLGTTAPRLTPRYVFNEMNFRCIYGEFIERNEASHRSHEKTGAEITGSRRGIHYGGGREVSAITYCIRRERFQEVEGETQGQVG